MQSISLTLDEQLNSLIYMECLSVVFYLTVQEEVNAILYKSHKLLKYTII